MGTEVTLEGEVERITFENTESGFRVLKVRVPHQREPVTVVGVMAPVGAGARVRVRGQMENDRRHGEQVRVLALTELAPSTLKGIERYLGSGMIKGVGEKYAQRIVARFGLETLKVLEETPEKLAEVEGLGSKRIEAIARAWRDQKTVREVMVFLQAHGASPSLGKRIIERYGDKAVHVVHNEPFRMAIDVWGVGFKTADRIAQELGIARDSPERIQAGVLQTVHDMGEAGHVYATEDELLERASNLLGTEAQRSAIDALVLDGRVFVEHVRGIRVVFGAGIHGAEVRLAKRVREVMHGAVAAVGGVDRAIARFEAHAKVSLAPEQRKAVEQAASAPMMVITGGPGVGKTTIVRAVLSLFEEQSVALAAPTGRAAKRITETTGREASTLHRLLEFDPKHAVFKRDAKTPLDARVVIVDEASMIDVWMADALLQAIAPGTRLILVGDVDQLPSIGPGAVLRDLIMSRVVPYVRLTQIFRQAKQSLIVMNAHRINAGEAPESATDPTADFFVIERRDPDQAKATVVELVTSRIPRRFNLDPVKDVQVLTPMHRGPAGSIALNEALQAALNPSGPSVTRGARTFRLGDKVMQLRNDYDRNVFNGDVGVVSRIEREEEEIGVLYDDREVIYEPGQLDELTLAYACSVHKSQGSEYPAVVIPLLTTHFVMLTKNLLYTAVTRGKRLVVLVADPRALSLALSDQRREERRTRLASRLAEAN